MDEAALIRKIIQGDTGSFRFLYRLHAASAWQLAFSICRHRTNAEEAVQNSFIAAFKYIGNFQHESTFKTWLLKIVFNESVRIQKKEKSYKAEMLDHTEVRQAEAVNIDAVTQLQKKELKEQVAATIALLSEKESVVLNLFYLEELSVKEVADILGFREANVRVLLHRARKNFKKNFENSNLALS